MSQLLNSVNNHKDTDTLTIKTRAQTRNKHLLRSSPEGLT